MTNTNTNDTVARITRMTINQTKRYVILAILTDNTHHSMDSHGKTAIEAAKKVCGDNPLVQKVFAFCLVDGEWRHAGIFTSRSLSSKFT